MWQVISGNPASHCLFLSSDDASTRQVVDWACQWRVDTVKYLLTEGVVTATVKTQNECDISYTCPPPKVILWSDYHHYYTHVYIHTHAVMVGLDKPVIPGHIHVELYIRPGNCVLLTAYRVCRVLLIFSCTCTWMCSMCQGQSQQYGSVTEGTLLTSSPGPPSCAIDSRTTFDTRFSLGVKCLAWLYCAEGGRTWE